VQNLVQKLRSIGLVLVLAGCRAEVPPQRSADVADTIVLSATVSSAAVTNAPTDTPSRVSFDDSLRDTLSADRNVVTAAGDTLIDVGGGVIDDVYWFGEYRGKFSRYAKIMRLLGHKSNGIPIWSIRATVLIPPMDSTEHIMPAGLCGIDYKGDPYIFAVVGIGGDSVYRNIRHAWRFERATETVHEIPTKNVMCFDPGED